MDITFIIKSGSYLSFRCLTHENSTGRKLALITLFATPNEYIGRIESSLILGTEEEEEQEHEEREEKKKKITALKRFLKKTLSSSNLVFLS